MYAVPHNRERPPLTFRAPTNHEYVKLCRRGVIGVRGLITPALYVSQMTDSRKPLFSALAFASEMTAESIIVELASL